MVTTLWMELQALLELDQEGPGIVAMALRTVIIYAATLLIVRLGSRRLLAKPSAFDVIVAIMAGSIMSRAINGSAPFVPTLGAGVVLVCLHWVFAALAFRFHWVSMQLKGGPIELVRDGKVMREGMRRAHVTDEDLAEALRLQVNDDDTSNVQAAYMERSGAISVIPRKR
jgi:uncharacterized membrane protein YcaP (DUF421 family)